MELRSSAVATFGEKTAQTRAPERREHAVARTTPPSPWNFTRRSRALLEERAVGAGAEPENAVKPRRWRVSHARRSRTDHGPRSIRLHWTNLYQNRWLEKQAVHSVAGRGQSHRDERARPGQSHALAPGWGPGQGALHSVVKPTTGRFTVAARGIAVRHIGGGAGASSLESVSV